VVAVSFSLLMAVSITSPVLAQTAAERTVCEADAQKACRKVIEKRGG